MNPFRKDNLLSFPARDLPAVVTMPLRSGARKASTPDAGKEDRKPGAVQPVSCSLRDGRKTSRVLAMPASRLAHGASSVIQMPPRDGGGDEASETPAFPMPGYSNFAESLRMTLVALFALLGWPRPTHGKDPGAAGARPWRPELLTLISSPRIRTAVRAGAAARAHDLVSPESQATQRTLRPRLASAA